MSHPISLAEENRVEHKLPADQEVDVIRTGDSGGQEFLFAVETKDSFASSDEESFARNRNVRGASKLVLSSTSSVYAKDTILNPNTDQVNYW